MTSELEGENVGVRNKCLHYKCLIKNMHLTSRCVRSRQNENSPHLLLRQRAVKKKKEKKSPRIHTDERTETLNTGWAFTHFKNKKLFFKVQQVQNKILKRCTSSYNKLANVFSKSRLMRNRCVFLFFVLFF